MATIQILNNDESGFVIRNKINDNFQNLNDENVVAVSDNDSTPDVLESKLVAGTNVTLTVNNDGGNETITIESAAGGSNTKHIFNFNKNLITIQRTVVDYTKTLTESLFGVSGVSYETSDDNGATWDAQADIAAVNTELGTWSADGFLRVIVTAVTNDEGSVVIEETNP